jgi:hypothetical protein
VKGPEFLKFSEEDWHKEKTCNKQKEISIEELELKSEFVNIVTEGTSALLEIDDFSSHTRLIRTTAWIYRFVRNCQAKVNKTLTNLSPVILLTEFEDAKQYRWKRSQLESFSEDISRLQTQQQISPKSRLRQLSHIIDSKGVLRLKGRIDAVVGGGEDVKRPVILDPDDPCSLTPNSFLRPLSTAIVGAPCVTNPEVCQRKLWRITQALTEQFWKRWTKEYLPTLTRRTKWYDPVKSIQKGDVVILVDDQLPRNSWPLGRIVEVFPGRDGVIRVVEVKTTKGTYRRPTAKVCVLDVHRDDHPSPAPATDEL